MMTIREETEKMCDDLITVLGGLPEEQSCRDLIDAAKIDKLSCIRLAVKKMTMPNGSGRKFPVKIQLQLVPSLPDANTAADIATAKSLYSNTKVTIRVCARYMEAPKFVPVLLHELSHLYLKILGSPYWNVEKYVDAIPLIMFTEDINAGRGERLCGYLSETEHEAVVSYIRRKRDENPMKKVLAGLKSFGDKLVNAKRLLAEAKADLCKLARDTPSMSFADAARVAVFANEGLLNAEQAIAKLDVVYLRSKINTGTMLRPIEKRRFTEALYSAENEAKQLVFTLAQEAGYLAAL